MSRRQDADSSRAFSTGGTKTRSRAPAQPPRRRKMRAKGGALLCLTLLLAGSGVLRLGGGVESGAAWAREFATEAGGAARAQPACTSSGDTARIMAALDERARKLDEREAAIEARLSTLAEAEDQIDRNMAQLVAAEQELASTMSMAEEAAEDDLSRLTAVYENMKPADAAALFTEMSPDFAAGFLGRMRPEAAAQIMAGLPSESAYALSVVMAGRNANVPTQ